LTFDKGDKRQILSQRKVIYTELAPKPIGPYSQGIVSNGFIFTAGQGAIDPKTNKWIGGNIREQTAQVLDNVKAVLEAGGSSLDKVVKVNVFLRRKELFSEMNDVYSKYFKENQPARSTVITDLLLEDMLIEIETIASV
jgi:2-iminobutanoate/2-iminopropanoate deaminase